MDYLKKIKRFLETVVGLSDVRKKSSETELVREAENLLDSDNTIPYALQELLQLFVGTPGSFELKRWHIQQSPTWNNSTVIYAEIETPFGLDNFIVRQTRYGLQLRSPEKGWVPAEEIWYKMYRKLLEKRNEYTERGYESSSG